MKSRIVAGVLSLAGLCLPASASAQNYEVFDFCSMEDAGQESDTYKKQKLIITQLSGLELIESGEVVLDKDGKEAGTASILSQVQGSQRFMEVWSMTLPLKRFYNIMSPDPLPAELIAAEQLSFEQVASSFSGQFSDFLARSVPCTDYLAVPVLKKVESKWTQGTKKKRQGKKTVEVVTHALSISPEIELAIFKKVDGRFVRHDAVSASGGGLFDFATALGSSTMSAASVGSEAAGERFKQYTALWSSRLEEMVVLMDTAEKDVAQLEALLSTTTDPTAVASIKEQIRQARLVLKDLMAQRQLLEDLVSDPQGASDSLARAVNSGWGGLVSGMPPNGSCEGELFSCAESAPFWLPERSIGVAGLSSRSTQACKEMNDEVQESVAACEVLVAAENITLQIQEAAQGVDGWRLYAPLASTVLQGAVRPAISLGDEEGVRAGAIFRAVEVDEQGNSTSSGFARVVDVGPGGQLGKASPTALVWRAGGAKHGVRMEEHPQIGVSLAISGGVSKITDASESLPQVGDSMAGGTLDVGYNLSPYTKWTWGEIWLRTHLDIYASTIKGGLEEFGFDGDLNYLVYNILAGPELKLYLFSRFDLFLGAAGGVSALQVSTPDVQVTVDGEEEDDSAAALSLGTLSLNAGFDILLHPDWSLRFGGEFKQNFGDAELEPTESDEGSVFILDDPKLGSLSAFSLQAGLTYIF